MPTRSNPPVWWGKWSELGYLTPTQAQSGASLTDALAPGVQNHLVGCHPVFCQKISANEQHLALRFIQMPGVTSRLIDRPSITYRDWIARTEAIHDWGNRRGHSLRSDATGTDRRRQSSDRTANSEDELSHRKACKPARTAAGWESHISEGRVSFSLPSWAVLKERLRKRGRWPESCLRALR